jgi:hypothetical protein
MTSELDAVNYLLDVLGSTPVGDLETLHPDLASCQTKLKSSSRLIQGPGMWYNREIGKVLVPNETTKEIALQADYLKVNASPYNDFAIQRGLKLYDSFNHTYQFEGSVQADIIQELVWDELPPSVQDSIMYHAAMQVCNIDLEDSQKGMEQRALYTQVFTQVKAENTELQRRNILRSPQALKVRSRYKRGTRGNNIIF